MTNYLDDPRDDAEFHAELRRLAMARYLPKPTPDEPEPIPGTPWRFGFLLVALAATTYATLALLTGLSTDSTVSILVAIMSLGGVFLIDHLDAERQRRREYRESVWARRDADA